MPRELHAARHATALKIGVAMRRAERACHDLHAKVALKELHQLLVDAHAAHGAELGLGGIEQYSGGIPK